MNDEQKQQFEQQQQQLDENQYIRSWKILIELKHLPRFVPQGVYCLPSIESLYEWYGSIFLRQGFYRNGVFHFKFVLPTEYPLKGPTKVTFLGAPIFHPQIKWETGELLLKEFAEWDAEKHNIAQILKYIKKIFYMIEANGFQNMEAADL